MYFIGKLHEKLHYPPIVALKDYLLSIQLSAKSKKPPSGLPYRLHASRSKLLFSQPRSLLEADVELVRYIKNDLSFDEITDNMRSTTDRVLERDDVDPSRTSHKRQEEGNAFAIDRWTK